MPLLEDFQALFRGRDDAWGSVEGKSNKEKVTQEHYRLHLEGKRSLGIYPLLDDGTCYFWAVDIDDKDFKKARAIRDSLYKLSIPSYIAESKSKGYHAYGFCSEGVRAADIRWVLFSVMEKLGFSAEVFPKQDRLDDLTKLGNYINLPCFGTTGQLGQRLFQTAGNQPIATEEAIKKIKPVPADRIREAKTLFPPPPASFIPQAIPQIKGRKKLTHPPCIETILRGVTQGCRDEAAFALARHYLDQQYLPEEVFTLLLQWDTRNKPPVGDMRVLQTKVQSAQKGYAFGCTSIKGDTLLSQFCPGELQCSWLAEVIKEKKKKGLLTERSFYETDGFLYEEITDTNSKFEQENPRFIAYNKETGEATFANQIEDKGVTIVPAYGDEVARGAVLLPSGITSYSSLDELVTEIGNHLSRYVDLLQSELEYSVWYIIMTWCYDRLFTVPYLRFRGDSGTGKSRCLDTIGRLCYKPLVVSGAITPAPIFRIIQKYSGTVILDEADFDSKSDEKSEVIKVLNSGFEQGRPILRCVKDDPNTFDCLACFGAKLLATRGPFPDIALEARCITFITRETNREDIPPILGKRFRLAQQELRKKLLAYRFLNYSKIIDDIEVEDLHLGRIEPRLKQTGTPLAVALRNNPETLDKFKTWLKVRNSELIMERTDSPSGRVVLATLKAAQQMGEEFVTPGAIKKIAEEEFKLDVTPQRIGRILKSLGITVKLTRVGAIVARYIIWDDQLMRRLASRYVVDLSEFADLFKEKEEENKNE